MTEKLENNHNIIEIEQNMQNITENEAVFEINTKGIFFNQYPQLKKDAEELAKYLKETVVTEETIKDNKKLVAGTTKATNKLKDELKKVKKYVLKPYEELKAQVDDITNTVKEAEEVVRQQVRDFEEQERHNKELEIVKLFENHVKHYDLVELYMNDPYKFFKPQFANKTVSLSSTETKLVEWLVRTEQDLQVLTSQQNPVELISCYQETGNLAEAFNTYEKRKLVIENIKKVSDDFNNKRNKVKEYVVKVFNKKDLELIKNYMQQMDIEYKSLD